MTSKAQKTRGWRLPEVITGYDLLCVQMKIPNEPKYRAAFAGAIQELAYWFNWEKSYAEGDTRAAQAAYYWRDLIDTYLCVENDPGSLGVGCGCCDDEPTNQRYTSDGFLEQSFDGGETWERDTSDPRFNSPIFPPMSGEDGDDKKCLAAASAAKFIDNEIVQKMNETDTAASLLLLIAAAVAILITGFTATPLVIALISQVIAFGVVATKAAFTTEVWDTFECILFCNMNDDGSFTEEQWLEIKTEIFDQLGSSIAGTFLRDTVNAMGVAGLTNAARSGAATSADCDDCDCPAECGDPDGVTCGTVIESGIEDGHKFLVIESGSCYGSFQSISWYNYGNTAPPAPACYITAYETVSGTFTNQVWTAPDGTVHENSSPGLETVSHFGFNTAPGAMTPFTVKVTF